MTLNEWAEVLSGIADAGERRDCLLVLADDLRNETGAEVLRGLARRDDGLSPEDMWDRWDWNAADVGFGGNILPEELIIGMASTRNDAGEFPPRYRVYYELDRCWLALLEALDSYEETNDE